MYRMVILGVAIKGMAISACTSGRCKSKECRLGIETPTKGPLPRMAMVKPQCSSDELDAEH